MTAVDRCVYVESVVYGMSIFSILVEFYHDIPRDKLTTKNRIRDSLLMWPMLPDVLYHKGSVPFMH